MAMSPLESQVTQEQILNYRFPHAGLFIPRVDLQDEDAVARVTIAPAALSRAMKRERLELRTSSKNMVNVLHHTLRMQDLETLQQTRESPSERGAFASMNSLGVTVAFFQHETEQASAMTELADEYDFVPNFPLTIPARVRMEDVPATRGRAALDIREWPEASGVGEAHARGIRGSGVLVGVLDTGVDADHVEFAQQTITYRYVSFFPNSPYWPPRDVRGFDTNGHGTHVSGIIAGRNVGVAPEATLYVASVIESETTRTSLIRVAYGLDWILRQFSRPDNEERPAVLNMSLGFPSTPPVNISLAEFQQRLQVIRLMLRSLVQANVLPCIAIGNDGPGNFGYPGAFKEVIGVGAVDFTGHIASFSGSGAPPAPDAPVSKPDLVGYGVGVYSSVERDYQNNPIYQRFNGTSMATPYVSGIATLYRCQQPALPVANMRSKLLSSALPLPNEPATQVGAGLARFVP